MKLTLQGYGPGAISAALANASTNNGSEKFALSDGTRITLLGVASVGDSSFA
jgi:hypothetical protein